MLKIILYIYNMRKPSVYKECPKCHKLVKARGMGGHLRLAHGIVIEKIVTQVTNSGTQVANSGANSGTQVANSGTQVKRQGDYVRKKSEVVEMKIVVPERKYEGMVKCRHCGLWSIGDGECTFCKMPMKPWLFGEPYPPLQDKCSGSAGEQPGPEATDRKLR